MFAAEGGKIVCAARTLHEGEHQFEGSLDKTVAGIRSAGGEATPVAVDISEESQCEKLIAAAHDAYGPVDVLVNNAALTYFIPIKDYPTNRWLRSWAVNFHAPFILSKLALQDMILGRAAASSTSRRARRSARAGARTSPTRGRRSAARATAPKKAALERFSQGLAAEVYQHGVSVTCFSPSQVVPTAGTIHHKLVSGLDDPRGGAARDHGEGRAAAGDGAAREG